MILPLVHRFNPAKSVVEIQDRVRFEIGNPDIPPHLLQD